MAEEEEVEKYKRLYEEQKAKVKELERQNSQLKVCLCIWSVGQETEKTVQSTESKREECGAELCDLPPPALARACAYTRHMCPLARRMARCVVPCVRAIDTTEVTLLSLLGVSVWVLGASIYQQPNVG